MNAFVEAAVAAAGGKPAAAAIAAGALVATGLLFAVIARPSVAPPRRLRVLITGATKGLGRALAAEFLRNGDAVSICSRSTADVESAVQMLGGGAAGVRGLRCDVAVAGDVAALFAFAKREMGGIDVVINNAGCNFSSCAPLELHSADAIARIVGTNVVGTLLCCREAIQCMKRQPAGGHIFNIDGAGSAQHATPSYAVYGCSKAGLPQLMRSLVAENRDTGVGIHTASPGMVITDLLLGKAGLPKRSLRIFNILAERPETVAAWMVPRLRAIALRGLHATEQARKAATGPVATRAAVTGADSVHARAGQHGAGTAGSGRDESQDVATHGPLDLPAARTLSGTYTKFLTPASAIWRFALFPWARNRLVDEDTGLPIAVDGSATPPGAR